MPEYEKVRYMFCKICGSTKVLAEGETPKCPYKRKHPK